MIKASEIAAIIESFAPLRLQEGWDNAGFCVGSPDTAVTGVLLALDCTLSLVMEAKERGVNMIVTHHPLIFSGIKRIIGDNPVSEVIIEAIKSDIVIYSAHTNADKTLDGVSWLMAQKLGLKNCRVLSPDPVNSMDGADVGLGVIGELEDSVSCGEFIATVKESFSLSSLKCSHPIAAAVGIVAVCGGSGKSLIADAKREGAGVYVSGDIPYHEFFTDSSINFMIMDVGHYESEIDIVKSIYSLITKKIPNFAVYITKDNINPVYYF